MKKQQIEFYNQAIDLYTEKSLPDTYFKKLFELIFAELADIDPNVLSIDHVVLMERTKKYFVEKEDFKKAQLIKELMAAADDIFEARAKHINLLKDIKNKGDDNEQT